MEAKEKGNKIQIELTKDEALVFFEWISEYNKGAKKTKGILDKSEEVLFWNFEATLEKLLTEPFLENYNELINKARKRIRSRIEE